MANKKHLESCKVFQVPFILSKDKSSVVIKLPTEALEKLGLKNKENELFYTITSGVIQLSVDQPQASIPSLLAETKFVQENG